MRRFWNKVFEATDPAPPGSSGCEALDSVIDASRHPGQHILDFGCGNGKLLYLFANGLKGVYHGIDLSNEAIEKARVLFENAGVCDHAFHVGDVTALDSLEPSAYDTVLFMNILDNMEEHGMKEVGEDFYLEQNGIYLFNKSGAYWEKVFSKGFDVYEKRPLHSLSHDQTIRLFILIKDSFRGLSLPQCILYNDSVRMSSIIRALPCPADTKSEP